MWNLGYVTDVLLWHFWRAWLCGSQHRLINLVDILILYASEAFGFSVILLIQKTITLVKRSHESGFLMLSLSLVNVIKWLHLSLLWINWQIRGRETMTRIDVQPKHALLLSESTGRVVITHLSIYVSWQIWLCVCSLILNAFKMLLWARTWVLYSVVCLLMALITFPCHSVGLEIGLSVSFWQSVIIMFDAISLCSQCCLSS